KQRPVQPDATALPVALDLAQAQAVELGDLGKFQAGEQAVVEQFDKARIVPVECVQRRVQRHQYVGLGVVDGIAFLQLQHDPSAAALAGQAAAGMVNHDLAHGARAQRIEMPAPAQVEDAVLEIGRDTSELQSRENLVCRLLLEKKKR